MTGSSLVPHSSLPPKPVSIHSVQATSSTVSSSYNPTFTLHVPFSPVSPSSSRSSSCAICSNPAKYTCPRCSTRTCSLPCSASHKTISNCSGQRDPTKYVPLKDYDQGKWDGDYKWLEEARRKVEEWGVGVEVGEVEASSAGRRRGGGRSGKRGNVAARKGGNGRLDMVVWRLRAMGIWVDSLPDGMERRRLNQSSWHAKSKTVYLTLQVILPSSPTDLRGKSRETIIQRHAVTSPLSTSLESITSSLGSFVVVLPYHARPQRRGPRGGRLNGPNPTTLTSNVADEPTNLNSNSTQNEIQRRPGVEYYFPPLDPSKPLNKALAGTAYIEFPTLHVILKDEWEGKIRNGEVEVVPVVAWEERGGTLGKRQCRDEVDGGETLRGQGDGEVEDLADKKKGDDMNRGDDDIDVTQKERGGDEQRLPGLGNYGSDEDEEDEDNEGSDIGENQDYDHDHDDSDSDDHTSAEVIKIVPPEMKDAVIRALQADFGQSK